MVGLILFLPPVFAGGAYGLLHELIDSEQLLSILVLAAGLATLISFAVSTRQVWRSSPLLEVGADGVRLQAEHYLNGPGARTLLVPWAEITRVGLAPAADGAHPAASEAPLQVLVACT